MAPTASVWRHWAFRSAYGNRTRDSSVKGRRLNPLTNAPCLIWECKYRKLIGRVERKRWIFNKKAIISTGAHFRLWISQAHQDPVPHHYLLFCFSRYCAKAFYSIVLHMPIAYKAPKLIDLYLHHFIIALQLPRSINNALLEVREILVSSYSVRLNRQHSSGRFSSGLSAA